MRIAKRNYKISYGQDEIGFDVPQGILVNELRMAEVQPSLSDFEILQGALQNPIGSPPVEELVSRGSKVCVICDDISRPTPTAKILELLLPRLLAAGVWPEDITLLLALGSHRLMTREELIFKLGKAQLERYRVLQSAFGREDSFTVVGRSSLDQPVLLSKAAMDADVRIGIGNIVPHNTLGFSGGAKILFPGIAAESSVAEFHQRAAMYAGGVFGQVENSVRDEVEDWAEQSGLHFLVNTILNRQGELVHCVAGHYRMAHRAGVSYAQKIYGVPFVDKADIVLVNGEPSSFDFWQGTKGLNAASIVVKEGGSVVLVAPCSEGVGPHPEYLDYLGGKEVDTEQGEESDPLAVSVGQMMYALSQFYTTYMYTSGLSAPELKRAKITKIDDIDELLLELLEIYGEDCLLTIIHDGAEILPLNSEDKRPKK